MEQAMKLPWSKEELKIVKKAIANKPRYSTDYEVSQVLAQQLGRSTESVRWQVRLMRKEEPTAVLPPKILILDIETLPIKALVWDVFKTTIPYQAIEKDWSILCWSAKWLFDSKVMGSMVTPEEAINRQDRSVLARVWELMDEADWIVTHNGDSFDLKKLNWRFFVNGFPKPSYYKSIDTKKIVNDNFAPTYSKLDWVAQVVGIGRKIETDFKWWVECGQGDKTYLNKMLVYNKQDVHLEEEVYLKLRPWMEKHPNAGLWSNQIGKVCPCCGGNDITPNGTYATALGLYQAFRCQKCGAMSRSTKKQYKLSSVEVN
jgi:hypothetical protein